MLGAAEHGHHISKGIFLQRWNQNHALTCNEIMGVGHSEERRQSSEGVSSLIVPNTTVLRLFATGSLAFCKTEEKHWVSEGVSIRKLPDPQILHWFATAVISLNQSSAISSHQHPAVISLQQSSALSTAETRGIKSVMQYRPVHRWTPKSCPFPLGATGISTIQERHRISVGM